MYTIKIKGGNKLKGTIEIGGAKNSAVALFPAAILSDKVKISNVPDILDIKALCNIFDYLNIIFDKNEDKISIDSTKLLNKPITLQQSKQLRASYYFTGALLGKYKHAEMYFPGGCSIGKRPIDLHLYGFEKLGAKITKQGEKFIIDADKLIGTEIKLSFASVGATINILFASVLAQGKTIIKNAAKEPEVGNVIDFLNSMGAKIKGKDSNILEIEGVSKLKGGEIEVIPDRIEAGTYIIAGVMAGDNLRINKVIPEHFASLTNALLTMGANIFIGNNYVIANKTTNLKPINITTEVYPGFPTDLQQPITPLLSLATGQSTITEKIYENRFQNIPYLIQMGANIKIINDSAIIKGPIKFTGCEVITTDLRAGAALILVSLVATGETKITEVKHILRGYENIIKKLQKVGVEICLEDV